MASMGTEIFVYDGIKEELLGRSAAPLATLAGGGRCQRHGDRSMSQAELAFHMRPSTASSLAELALTSPLPLLPCLRK